MDAVPSVGNRCSITRKGVHIVGMRTMSNIVPEDEGGVSVPGFRCGSCGKDTAQVFYVWGMLLCDPCTKVDEALVRWTR